MAEILAPAFKDVVFTTPGSFQENNAAEVYQTFKDRNQETTLVTDTGQALAQTRNLAGTDRPILVAGCLYLAGAVREILY